MALEKIQIGKKEPLNVGAKKINDAIDAADKASKDSTNAVNTSNQAKQIADQANQKSDYTQTQLDTVTGASTIDPAVEQMKVGSDGSTIYNSPDERVRKEHQAVTALLAEREQEIAENAEQIVAVGKRTDTSNYRATNFLKGELITGALDKQIATAGTCIAFPSIAIFNGVIYVVYRRGAEHASFDGRLEIMSSTDKGKTWSAFSIIWEENGKDFRDPQLVVFNGKLVLRAFYRTESGERHLIFSDSADGVTWKPYKVVTPPTGHTYSGSSGSMIIKDGVLISTAYTYPHPCSVFVVTTTDLTNFTVKIVMDASVYGYGASESTIEYLEGSYRIFCRPSPEGSRPRFTLRTNSTFDIEYLQKNVGNLDGPRSLKIDDKNAFLTYRDRTKDTHRVVIAITDRNGETAGNVILQTEQPSDSGYFDLKLDGNAVIGVYYAQIGGLSGSYTINFVRYDLNDLKQPYLTAPPSIKMFNGTFSNIENTRLAVGHKSYFQDAVSKTFDIVLDVKHPITRYSAVNFNLRCADANHYIVNLKGIVINGNTVTLTVKVRNIEGVTSTEQAYLQYQFYYI